MLLSPDFRVRVAGKCITLMHVLATQRVVRLRISADSRIELGDATVNRKDSTTLATPLATENKDSSGGVRDILPYQPTHTTTCLWREGLAAGGVVNSSPSFPLPTVRMPLDTACVTVCEVLSNSAQVHACPVGQ